MNDILESIRGRKSRKAGIVTADRYLRSLNGCFDGGFCPTNMLANCSNEHWEQLVKDSASKLVYTDKDMQVGEFRRDMTPNSILDFDCIITSTKKDRDGDILESSGAEIDPYCPLLWQHNSAEPIGKLVSVTNRTNKNVSGRLAIANTPLGRDAAILVEFGALRISHGFDPTEYEPLKGKDAGWHIKKFSVVEVSLVSVPSNTDAVITALSKGKLHSPLVKGWATHLKEKTPRRFKGFDLDELAQKVAKRVQPEQEQTCGCKARKPKAMEKPATDETIRWNPRLSKAFDVAMQEIPPSCTEYDWAAKYLEVPVKRISSVSFMVPSARMGSFLTALRNETKEFQVDDTRNILYNGTEQPPVYETIQLNSKLTDTFLVEGTQFLRRGNDRLIISRNVNWGGINITVYARDEDADGQSELINKSWEGARRLNFLKGEAFALSGEFLPRGDQDWQDVFLTKKNEEPLRKCVNLINSKGESCANRGIVMMGPPGTGKTLSGRVIKNKADATFIWISSRDFHRSGAFGGFSYAFDLARELAPSVLFVEDVDNWMDKYTIDLLKTEMDGMAKSSGIVTILTTNYPERFPDALIDRPGRFHDVLKFDNPDKPTRERMLNKWLPGIGTGEMDGILNRTDGYSGAHIYELASFSKTIQEQDELPISDAVRTALDKIAEQRELISESQLSGSHYSPRKDLMQMQTKSATDTKTDTTMGAQAGDNPDGDPTMGPQVKVCPKCAYKGKPDEFKDADPDADMEAGHIAESDEDEEETKSLKSGKKLSAKNVKRLEHIKGHMEHICGLSEDEMGEHGRPVKSMCKEVHGHVSDMLEEAKKEMPQPADEGAEMYQAGYTGAKAHFLMEVSEHPEDIKGIHDYLGKLLQEHEAAEVLKLFGGAA